MNSNPPQPAPSDRPADKRPALSAVFGRLAAAAPSHAAAAAQPVAPAAAPPVAPLAAKPAAPVAAPPVAPAAVAPVPPTPAPPAPSWLTKPVLAIDIPHSPLGRGTVSAPPAVPETIGFAEPEAEFVAPTAIVEPVAAAPVPPPVPTIAALGAAAPDIVLPVEIDFALPPPRGNGVAVPSATAPSAAPPSAMAPSAAPRRAAPLGANGPRPAVLRPAPRPRRPALRPLRRPAPGGSAASGIASSGIADDSPLANLAVRLGRGTGKVVRRSLPPEPAAAPEAAPRPSAARPAARLLSPAPLARPPLPGRPPGVPASALLALRRPAPANPVAVPETRSLAQNRRLYRRVMLAAELEIAGIACRLIDLSIGGFAAAGAPPLVPNTVVPVSLRMTIDGIDIGTQFASRIVYAGEVRTAGGFVDLSAAQTAFLRYVVTWRGESVGAVGTKALLDAVTRSPERAFPPHPSTVPPPDKTSWWQRWLGRIPLLGWRRPQ